jgi:sugar phosphate isomerase/epimerase
MKELSQYGTNHPLGVIYLTPFDLMKRFGLNTEVLGDFDKSDPRLENAVTAHAPWCIWKTGFYNIGDRDDAWRTESIQAIEQSIRHAAQHKNIRKVVMHPGPRKWYQWEQKSEGDYDRMISAIRRLADIAAGSNLELCLENTSTVWKGIPDETPVDKADRSIIKRINYGSSPEEWRQIALDSDRLNISLCLDPSHAATFIQLEPDPLKRMDVAEKYLAHPELISHVHWNDSDIQDNAGREDMHLPIGEGTFPAAFHKWIKELEATIILEHFTSAENLEKELRYIESL